VGTDFLVEAPLLRPLPTAEFPTRLTLEPRVDRYTRVTVRQCFYSVPAKLIGRRVRVQLGACTVAVFGGHRKVAVHERITVRGEQSLNLDHYLEVLQRKPGATALVQARASGAFTQAHDEFWAAARHQPGDSKGTQALVEVLLLQHRHLPPDDVIAGITAALRVESVSPDVVAVEARKSVHPDGPITLGLILPRVVDLGERRALTDADVPAQPSAVLPGRRAAVAVGGALRRPAHRGRLMTTRKGVTERAAVAAIDGGCRTLRLPTIRSRFGEIAAAAEREQLSYLGFLAELVMAECDDRDSRRAVRRMNAAGFPRDKRVDEFDFDANPNVPAATVHQLAGCGWVKAGQPLCLIGDSGTGKTHLLIALGTAAAQVGHSVRYVLASKLVNELVEAADDKQLSKTIARYGRVDLLICDELGYLELDRRGAELLFQVLTEREEKSAIAIASNEPFSGWTKTFTDPRLCAAIVDRLTFNGQIIETGTTSYRLAHARRQSRAVKQT
jgi:DNA replication protein DnaC